MSDDQTLRRRDFLARTAAAAILQEDEQRHHDEMGELEVLADRFGIQVPESKPSDLFRTPDSVRKAVLAHPS